MLKKIVNYLLVKKYPEILLKGERIIIRNFILSDFSKLEGSFQDKELIKYAFGLEKMDMDLKEMFKKYKKQILNGSGNYYSILYKDEFSGIISSYYPDRKNKKLIKLGLMITEEKSRNIGIGTESLNLIIDHLEKTKGLHEIQMDTAIFNERAVRCFRKCGFDITGEFVDRNGVKKHLLSRKFL